MDKLLLTVQLAFETTDIEELYSFRFTPTTMVFASLHIELKHDLTWDIIRKKKTHFEGAEITTFLAPLLI